MSIDLKHSRSTTSLATKISDELSTTWLNLLTADSDAVSVLMGQLATPAPAPAPTLTAFYSHLAIDNR